MLSKTQLRTLAKKLVKALSRGTVSQDLLAIGKHVASDPAAAGRLLDLIVAEDNKEQPDAEMILAFAHMLGLGLTELRYQLEAGNSAAQDAIEAIVAQTQALADAGSLSPTSLMAILQQFVTARLEIDPALQDRHGEMVPAEGIGPEQIDQFLQELTAGFDGDLFALQGQFAEMTATFPEQMRGAIPAMLLEKGREDLRECTLGWLLDSGPATRRDVAELLQEAAQSKRISGIMLRRMIMLRNWLPDDERPVLDQVIRGSRLNGVECAPLSAAKIISLYSSVPDGSGAISLFALVAEGRKFAVVSILIKLLDGVRDVFILHDMTKANARATIKGAAEQLGLFSVTLDYITQIIGHGLSLNAQTGTLPPFWLVGALETLGLAAVPAQPLSWAGLRDQMFEAIPSRQRGAGSVTRVLRASPAWPERFEILYSWMAEPESVQTLLGTQERSLEECYELVLDTFFTQKRQSWADIMTLMAFVLSFDPEQKDMSKDFLLFARELAGSRSLKELPLMCCFAEHSVDFVMGNNLFGNDLFGDDL